MVELTEGNLLRARVEALVNTVNCVGVMGKGIALQFKQGFPENFRVYEAACRAGAVEPGRVLVVPLDHIDGPRFVINFPTKRHWRERSRLEDIRSGLQSLVSEVRRLRIRSLAVPPLGCGNGGLDWRQVRPLIEQAFAEVPDVRVLLYPPAGSPVPGEMPIGTAPPRWTHARALLVRLVDLYCQEDHSLSHLEIQKLAYFLQASGEPLRLTFTKGHYGPYANELHHVIQRLEGHFFRGVGDRSSRAEITVLPAAAEQARERLAGDPQASERLARIERLIAGFESPYGLELLATVHWVTGENPAARTDASAALADVQAWSTRKRRLMQPEHVQKSWRRLQDEGWLAMADHPRTTSRSAA